MEIYKKGETCSKESVSPRKAIEMKGERPEKKSRRRIIRETKQVLWIIPAERTEKLFCSVCGESNEMLSPLAAAKFFGISTREIYRLIEAGKAHAIEFADRRLFVCPGSLNPFVRPGGGLDLFEKTSIEI